MNKKSKSTKIEVDDLSNLFNKGEYSLVEKKSLNLLDRVVDDFRIWNFLGLSYLRQEKYDLALKSFSEGIELCPYKTNLLNNLSLVYSEQGLLNEALECLENSLKIKNNQFIVHFRLGNLHYKSDDHERAKDSYLKAVKLEPHHYKINLNLSILYKETGEIAKALDFCEKAKKCKNTYGLIHRHKASITKYNNSDDIHIKEMKNLLQAEEISLTDKMEIHFGLSKALEDCGEFNLSFKHLDEANRIFRSNIKYSTHDQAKVFREIKQLFNVNCTTKKIDENFTSQSIFVLGMPRSGTSLIEQIFSSHSRVNGGGELKNLLISVKKSFADQGYQFPLNNNVYSELHQKKILETYKNLTHKYFLNEDFLVDKMPYNFLLIGFIKTALPGSKIILATRNPIENCLSIYKQKFKSGNNFAYSLKEIAEYYNLYKDLISHWRTIFTNPFHEIKYEDLVSQSENEIKKLLKYCNLDWEEDCLRFHQTKRVVKTASAAQVRLPIYNSSVSMSKNYGDNIKELAQLLDSTS